MAIHFFTEDIKFDLKNKRSKKSWIKSIAEEEGYKIAEINYVFCSDDYLLDININYLDHDTYTDIITFDNSESEKIIESDIYISIDRVRENAKTHDIPFEDELDRVLIHGVLHLCGYKDKTEEEEINMRLKENNSLSKRQ
ncbi:rRNA maturation RNase YbeY [Penaeicola halotolerans]|uniref:rRNA maturation RNase YbeY n=1 Tax=Penaeicola halotolerans TaxID=2793196 RepID=UPI001CF89F56|nr:rRNA maturation RNase YbeY [Penaeicola halotolerans]